MHLKRPDTCEAAQAYVGTTLKKWWAATALSEEGWYSCSVQGISDDVIQLDDGTEQKGLWLLLRFVQHCPRPIPASYWPYTVFLGAG